MKNRSHRCDINRPRPRDGPNASSIMMAICIKQHLMAAFETQFLEKLSNPEAELVKRVAYKRSRYIS